MNSKIMLRKKVKASYITEAMNIIKIKYPYAKLITYKFDKDFKYINKEKRDYKNRTMSVVFIDDVRKIWGE